MFLTSLRGKGRQCLALPGLFLLPLTFAHATPASNQADVQLKTDLNTLTIQIGQGAPLPPGGCNPGYLWHTTYGGCRIAQTQSESGQCPPGYVGSRTRYRTAFILQANPADVAFDAWSAWHDSCQRPRAAGLLETVIASKRGADIFEVTDDLGPKVPYGTLWEAMNVSYGSRYGVTIDRPTATLNCLFAYGSTSSSGESSVATLSVWQLAPGASVSNRYAGYCHLSNGGQIAELYGSCDGSSGGDGDSCTRGRARVTIIAADQCTVTTETRHLSGTVQRDSYDICQ